MIDVQHRQGDWLSEALRSLHLQLYRFLDTGMLEQPGQAVPADLLLQLTCTGYTSPHGGHQLEIGNRLGQEVIRTTLHGHYLLFNIGFRGRYTIGRLAY